MQYTEINGLSISGITLGTVALGKQYGISNNTGKPDASQTAEVFRAALAEGINTFDTANDYGNAEELMGEFFKEDATVPEPVTVTKFKISKENLFDNKQAREEAYRSVLSSLKLLNLKSLPVCLYHKEADVPVDRLMDILPAIFADMQKEGLVGLAGVSVYHPQELQTFSGNDIFKAFQVPMNIFDHRLRDLGILPQIKQDNKIIFIRSVFLQGLFFMRPEQLTGNLRPAAAYLEQLKEIAGREKISVAQLAFSFVRDTAGVTSTVFGAVNAAQVKENARLFHGPSLTDSTIVELKNLARNIPPEIIIPGKWSTQS